MAKKGNTFLCVSCNEEFTRWLGRCTACGEWNTLVEVENPSEKRKVGPLPDARPLSVVTAEVLSRIPTGLEEFDLVCGGGMVPGSVLLIGGEPGVGKSTLALQIANSFRMLYFSGEESPLQIRYRADRLKVDTTKIKVSPGTMVEEILALIDREKPQCIIIDSIQTLYSSEVAGSAGSVGQIRESATRLVEMAKRSSIPVILIGHITKEGSIAGPKILEHLVDTVLYFEGDFSRDYRILRAFKNRFGSVNEIGLFRMTDRGLETVKDKNSVFLHSCGKSAPGSAVSAALEGSRTILFEVQSLVTFSSFSNPRRMADGLDFNRLILILAVLEKHALLKFSGFDVFINVAGGFQINETAADLAVAMAAVSSLKDRTISPDTGLLGEISLSGEIRPVSQCTKRVLELGRGGFKTVLLPRHNLAEAEQCESSLEFVGVETVSQAMDYLF